VVSISSGSVTITWRVFQHARAKGQPIKDAEEFPKYYEDNERSCNQPKTCSKKVPCTQSVFK